MAKAVWVYDTNISGVRMKDTLRTECLEQARNTLYTSTSFYIWLRCLRFWRGSIWFAAVACSTVAASSIVSDFGWPAPVVAGLTLAGVLLPAVVKALKLDETIEAYSEQAAKFKNVEGRLGRAGRVWSEASSEVFESEARSAFEDLDEARLQSLTPPEWCFKKAQKKIQTGDYDPDPINDEA